jgi:hypothetical protein
LALRTLQDNPILLLVVALPLVYLAFQYGGRLLIHYRLTDRSLLVLLFWIVPVSRTRYETVEEIRAPPRAPSLRDAVVLRLPNRLWNPVGTILILRKGMLPLQITPGDPKAFVQELRRGVYEETGRWPLVS